ncbi:CTB family bacteriocin [Phormidesmis priestleyi]
MSTETTSALAIVELSEAELDTVAGGFDIAFSMSSFEQSETSSVHETGHRHRHRSHSSHTRAFAFQFVGTGFQSPGEALSFLSGLSKLFGR